MAIYKDDIIETFADELSVKLERSPEEIQQNGLSAYDFNPNDAVSIEFETDHQ